jgi:hypothetical protein
LSFQSVAPANDGDARPIHRPMEKHQNLAAIRMWRADKQNDYTIQFAGKIYGIETGRRGTGPRGAAVRVEQRRDGTVAIRFRDMYLCYQVGERAQPAAAAKVVSVRKKGAYAKSPEGVDEGLSEGCPDYDQVRRSPFPMRQGNSPNDRIPCGPDCYRPQRVCAATFPATSSDASPHKKPTNPGSGYRLPLVSPAPPVPKRDGRRGPYP